MPVACWCEQYKMTAKAQRTTIVIPLLVNGDDQRTQTIPVDQLRSHIDNLSESSLFTVHTLIKQCSPGEFDNRNPLLSSRVLDYIWNLYRSHLKSLPCWLSYWINLYPTTMTKTSSGSLSIFMYAHLHLMIMLRPTSITAHKTRCFACYPQFQVEQRRYHFMKSSLFWWVFLTLINWTWTLYVFMKTPYCHPLNMKDSMNWFNRVLSCSSWISILNLIWHQHPSKCLKVDQCHSPTRTEFAVYNVTGDIASNSIHCTGIGTASTKSVESTTRTIVVLCAPERLWCHCHCAGITDFTAPVPERKLQLHAFSRNYGDSHQLVDSNT